jgi:thioester reductase-like protein
MADGLLLVTGFPGFIGSRLVEALIRDDSEPRVVALVEERMEDVARQAAGEIGDERIEVLVGDITDGSLGLDDDAYERLLAEARAVFHLAAVYDLAVPYDLAQRVNVEGTANVVEFCRRAQQLDRLNYVSTAFVAGTRRGVVYEHELSVGQGFKNHYEATKFQAELWVRRAADEVPTTIIRPAVVVGDSRTGETAKFDGPYYLLRLISLARRLRLPVPRVGRGEALANVVPVDYVVAAVACASRDPSAAGKTLHLVDPEPVTMVEAMRLLTREYAQREPAYRLPAALGETSLRLPPVRRMLGGMPRESIPYVDHPVRFDPRRATELLGRHGLVPPRLPGYVGPLVEFFRRHEDDPRYAT